MRLSSSPLLGRQLLANPSLHSPHILCAEFVFTVEHRVARGAPRIRIDGWTVNAARNAGSLPSKGFITSTSGAKVMFA